MEHTAMRMAHTLKEGLTGLPRAAAVSVAALLLGVLAVAAPAAQASARPAAGSATTYPYTFSRIAWTGSDQVIAAIDNHGGLYYFWQAAGTTTWHKQLVASGGAGAALAGSPRRCPGRGQCGQAAA